MQLPTNLMGVKREKEPLTGIAPVKRLFDRSLQFVKIQRKIDKIIPANIGVKETMGWGRERPVWYSQYLQ